MNGRKNEYDPDIRDMVIKMHDMELRMMPSAEELQARYVLSDQFYERMDALIENMARRGRRSRRIRYTAGWAAALLLTFLIVNMSGVAEACWNVTDWFEEYVMFHFQEPEDSDLFPEYALGYVPQGYVLTDSVHTQSHGHIAYAAGDQTLTLEYGQASMQVYMNTQDRTLEEIPDGRGAVIYYFSSNDGSYSSLLWLSEDEEICFTLTGTLPREELLRIRENIFEKN